MKNLLLNWSYTNPPDINRYKRVLKTVRTVGNCSLVSKKIKLFRSTYVFCVTTQTRIAIKEYNSLVRKERKETTVKINGTYIVSTHTLISSN
jgi:hypothetical protein